MDNELRRRDVLQVAAAFMGITAAGRTITPAPQPRAERPKVVLSDANAVVETVYGRVRGYTEEGIHTFKGIPYGAPPVGDLRFMPPERPKPWQGVRDSLQYGPACPQPAGRSDDLSQFFFQFSRGPFDEDCLRLNIWTPSLNDNPKRPVMLWLHGGGFATGSSFELPSYDGRNLAARGDVVVVSLNHRLNVLGFAHLGEYGERYADSANVGMLDIVFALQWLRDNVGNFGGDPRNVTVFGQSGGGAKVNFLMAMPAARGLFHKAIVQSATPFSSNRRSREFSVKHTAAFLAALGLTRSSLDALRNLPQDILVTKYFDTYFRTEFEHDAQTRWSGLTESDLRSLDLRDAGTKEQLSRLVQARHGYARERAEREVALFVSRTFSDNIGPLPDGRVIVGAPFNPTAPAISADVPLLIGHTLNEGGGLYAFSAVREAWTDEDMRAELARSPTPVPPGLVAALQRAYPAVKSVEIFVHATGGLRYRVDAVTQATQKAGQGAAPVYLYTFAWKTSVLDGRPRAFHRAELPFVFANTDRCAQQTGGTQSARSLAEKMSDAWIAFARTGNPNHSGIPSWPSFDPDRVPTMFFDESCEVRYDHDREARQRWDKA